LRSKELDGIILDFAIEPRRRGVYIKERKLQRFVVEN